MHMSAIRMQCLQNKNKIGNSNGKILIFKVKFRMTSKFLS